MNSKEFLEKLSRALQAFLVHRLLISELMTELRQSGNESSFLRVLLARLKYLIDEGLAATRHKEFEPLEDGIYSMHLTGKGYNIRILYAFCSNGRPALLLAFHERAGHTATDYSGKCKTASKRLKDLEEESK